MLPFQAGGKGYIFRYYNDLLTAVKPDEANKQTNKPIKPTNSKTT